MMENAYWSRDTMSIKVICRYWQEDGVWNGSVKRLPIAVFGQTLEETKANLRAAFRSHMAAMQSIPQVGE